jgi:hypothetical protein
MNHSTGDGQSIFGNGSGSFSDIKGLYVNKNNYYSYLNSVSAFRLGSNTTYIYYNDEDSNLIINTPKFSMNKDGDINMSGSINANYITSDSGSIAG